MNYKTSLVIISLLIALVTNAQFNNGSFSNPPDWAKKAIWYQIFVERFYNGDHKNDPTPQTVNSPFLKEFVPSDWSTTAWTSNWYQKDKWAEKAGMDISANLQNRKYGGDLQGVMEKLPYLQSLGITALFLNPLNDAPSMHKYDARNYHHIDVNFGPDPVGDQKIIASENPADPKTWKWTSADRLFLKLVKEVHRLGMKIIIDYSWNHTGTNFWAWQDIIKNQGKSAYKDWYDILSFDDPSTTQNEFAYKGWLGINSLPELKKVTITSPRVTGHPYEGNINECTKAHIFSVTKRWLAPDGDINNGIDGYRLDVADQIGMGFWREFRKEVRAIKPSSYLIGEIWWEKWPDQLMNPAPYTKGDVFDAVMYYQTYRPARYFFAKNDFSIDAKTFKDSLELQWARVPEANRYAMMNVSSSHDAPRLLTDFFNPNKYKFGATPTDNKNYQTGKPDKETYDRLKLYLVHLFTTVGAPQIFNGEEMGMWGADDPFNRKPLMWKEFSFDPETKNYFQKGEKQFDSLAFNQDQFNWYQKLIKIRKSNEALYAGDLTFFLNDGKKLGYKRAKGENEILIIFNLENQPSTITLPSDGNYEELITNKIFNGNKVSLTPNSAMILKLIKNKKVDLVLQDIAIVDVLHNRIQEHQTVVIDEGRIIATGKKEINKNFLAKLSLVSSGKFIMPSLWDMHVHFGGDTLREENKWLLPLFIAMGVTTVRDCAGDISDDVLDWKKAIAENKLVGPTIFTSGPKLEGPKSIWPGDLEIANETEMNLALDSLQKLKVDFIKITDNALDPALFVTSIKASRKRGWKVSGHAPVQYTLNELSDAGLSTVEHLGYMLRAASKDEERITALRRENKLNAKDASLQLMQSIDSATAIRKFKLLAANGTAVVPTMNGSHITAYLDQDNHQQDGYLKYLGPALKRTYAWRVDRAAKDDATAIIARHQGFEASANLIPWLYQAGVPFLAGTDAGYLNSFNYPGIGLHYELAMMVHYGLPIHEALKASVINGPAFFNQSKDFGAVEKDKIADLLILDANPLIDIHNTQKIFALVRKGTYLNRTTIDNLLSMVAQKVAAKEAAEKK